MALSLDQQLADLPPDVQAMLAHHRFDPERFKQLAGRLRTESAEDNFMKGTIKPPPADALVSLPPVGSPEYNELVAVGEQALREGRVALLVLAGGMATRMGGVIKALVDAIPGKSFLDLRRAEMPGSHQFMKGRRHAIGSCCERFLEARQFRVDA